MARHPVWKKYQQIIREYDDEGDCHMGHWMALRDKELADGKCAGDGIVSGSYFGSARQGQSGRRGLMVPSWESWSFCVILVLLSFRIADRDDMTLSRDGNMVLKACVLVRRVKSERRLKETSQIPRMRAIAQLDKND